MKIYIVFDVYEGDGFGERVFNSVFFSKKLAENYAKDINGLVKEDNTKDEL